MSAPSVLQIGKRLLRDLGIVSLDPAVPANQVTPIESGDLDDVAMVMSQAFQEIYDDGPTEISQRPGSGYLRGPTNLTLNVTLGSATVAAVTTYSSWMEGCTIRIEGDPQDNELVNSTTLARPYTGTTATGVSAVLFNDAITLDETIQHVMEPLFVAHQQWPIPMARSLEDFMTSGGWPRLADVDGRSLSFSYSNPYYWTSKRPTGQRPWVWIQDGFEDPTLSYVKRRLRFSPMPDAALSIGFTKLMNPPRITAEDLVAGSVTVSGATLPTSANGTYFAQGAGNIGSLYIKAGNDGADTFFLWNVGDNWVIQIGDDYPDTGSFLFSLESTSASPAGTYTVGTGTGTVVVAIVATALPIPNAWVESIYTPICRQLLTGLAQFKNSSAIPEIARSYTKAKERLTNSQGAKGDIYARYPR